VELEAPAARLGQKALQDVGLAAAPEVDRDAGAAPEVLAEADLVVGRQRGVEHQLAFLLRAGEQARGPVRAGVSGNFKNPRRGFRCKSPKTKDEEGEQRSHRGSFPSAAR